MDLPGWLQLDLQGVLGVFKQEVDRRVELLNVLLESGGQFHAEATVHHLTKLA